MSLVLLSPGAWASESRPELPRISEAAFHQAALANAVQTTRASQLAEWLKSGDALLIDLNSADAFAVQHLEGAINLPATELTDETLESLIPNKNTRLVLYCADTLYLTRRIALTTLGAAAVIQLGYKNTTLLEPVYHSDDCKAAKKTAKTLGICGDLLRLIEKPRD
jgi:phage shock protein E